MCSRPGGEVTQVFPDGVLELVPVGKACSGFTDEELLALDRWVRAHTTSRSARFARSSPGWCWR